ncbi:hypothetical protein LCGC14_0607430 [marine sediment metagenome]|uniref:Uncharacterized protein n=1 Tax=marine sediment metagenome TaxID=412755 RepID=A0A0F9RSU6_9ZZZZ
MSNGGKGTAVLAGAGIGAILTYLLAHPSVAQAATAPEGVDAETWDALTAIILAIQEQNARLELTLSQVVTIMGGEGSALLNPSTFTTPNVICPVAGQAYPIPSKIIPYDKEFVVKALSTNAGLIYLANNEVDAAILTASYPLLPNEAVGLGTATSNDYWISAQFAGEGASCIVEQK